MVVGLRYGSGTLNHKIEGQLPVYWTGPSIGLDAGANAGNMTHLGTLGVTERMKKPTDPQALSCCKHVSGVCRTPAPNIVTNVKHDYWSTLCSGCSAECCFKIDAIAHEVITHLPCFLGE